MTARSLLWGSRTSQNLLLRHLATYLAMTVQSVTQTVQCGELYQVVLHIIQIPARNYVFEILLISYITITFGKANQSNLN